MCLLRRRERTCRQARRGGGLRALLLGLSIGVLPALAAVGQSPVGAFLDHVRESPQLLGDPAATRSQLERLGINLQLFYNQSLGWKPRGGAQPDSTTGHSGSYDFFLRADLEELVSWPGLALLLHARGQYDDDINADVGAASDPIDDADFDEPIYLDELWLEQAMLHDRLRLRAGFLEQQTVFDRNAFANSEDLQFMTAFLDNDPVVPLPNGVGGVLFLEPAGWLEVVVGVADGDMEPRGAGFETAFDRVDSVTGHIELLAKLELPDGAQGLPGHYRLGAFVDGREQLGERGHWGGYGSFDQLVYRERPDAEEGLGLFARFGVADPKVNPIAWFWSLGLAYRGPIPGRGADVLGLGSYQAIGSHRYRGDAAAGFDRETGIECYYRVEVLPWLAVTPDLQYVFDPGGSKAARDAVVAVLRLRVTL